MKNTKKLFFLPFIFAYFCLADSIQTISIKKIEVSHQDGSAHLILLLNGIFSSNLKKFIFDGNQVILLKNTILDNQAQKNLSKLLLPTYLGIFSKNKNTYIVLNPNNSKTMLDIKALKSIDGYVLKLIFTPQEKIDNLSALLRKPSELKSAPIESYNQAIGVQSYQYWSVLGVIAFLIIVLIIIKKKLNSSNLIKRKFQDSSLSLQVKFCEKINANNQIVLLQSQNTSYLLLIGEKQSLLLDKIDLESKVQAQTIVSPNNIKSQMKHNNA